MGATFAPIVPRTRLWLVPFNEVLMETAPYKATEINDGNVKEWSRGLRLFPWRKKALGHC